MLTTGKLLQEERKKRKFTLGDIERATRIRKKNLRAIEAGNWNPFSSKTYIIGVIRSYARYLKLDEDKLVAFFRREYEKKEDIKFKKRVVKSQLTPRAKKIFKLTISSIILVFVLYFGYQLKLYFSPPVVKILAPTEPTFTKEKKVELVGKTDPESIVKVNGERVFLDSNNVFKIFIPLPDELNKVTIEVVGANGKKTVVKKIFEKKK